MFEEKIGPYIENRTIFFDHNSYLSNFYPSPIRGDVITKKFKLDFILPDMPSVEHAYNSLKFAYNKSNLGYITLLSRCEAPRGAQLMGNGMVNTTKFHTIQDGIRIPLKSIKCKIPKLDSLWNDKKLNIMRNLVKIKFETHEDLMDKLLEIKNNFRIVDNNSMDNYWGVGKDYKGENRLGILLEELRPKSVKFIYAIHKDDFVTNNDYLRYISIGKCQYLGNKDDKNNDILLDYIKSVIDKPLDEYIFFNRNDLRDYSRALPYTIQGGRGLSKYPGKNREKSNTKGLIERFDPDLYIKELYIFKGKRGKIPIGYDSSLVVRGGIILSKYPVIHENVNFVKISPEIYDYGLIHLTQKDNLTSILDSGHIKADMRRNDQISGIYFSLFKNLSHSLSLDDDLMFTETSLVDAKSREYVYGDIGFVYSLGYIFDKYKVALKEKENFGKGRNLSLHDYINFYPGECIVDSRKMIVDSNVFLAVVLHPEEIDFIHDVKCKTVLDLINLYIENQGKWYVRKSAFIKVIKEFEIDEFPKIIFIRSPYSSFSQKYKDKFSVYKDSDQDVESDWDDM